METDETLVESNHPESDHVSGELEGVGLDADSMRRIWGMCMCSVWSLLSICVGSYSSKSAAATTVADIASRLAVTGIAPDVLPCASASGATAALSG